MPGSRWKHDVRSLDSNLGRCKKALNVLNAPPQQQDETLYREQVYKNSNTVVEVAVKTHKRSRTTSSNRLVVPKSTSISHDLVDQGKQKSSQIQAPSWHDRLSPDIHSRKKPYNKSTFNSRLRSKSDTAKVTATSTGKQKSADEDDPYKNAALDFFVNELKRSLSKSSTNPDQINKIIENMQYIISKEKKAATESGCLDENKPRVLLELGARRKLDIAEVARLNKEIEAMSRQLIEEQKGHLQTQQALRQRTSERDELKAMLVSQTNQNNEMLAMLASKTEEQSMEEVLRQKMEEQMRKNLELRAKLETKEVEVHRLQKIISEMTSSLAQDLDVVRLGPARVSTPGGDLEEPPLDDDSQATERGLSDNPLSEKDSAIEEGTSESQQQNNNVIESAKKMLAVPAKSPRKLPVRERSAAEVVGEDKEAPQRAEQQQLLTGPEADSNVPLSSHEAASAMEDSALYRDKAETGEKLDKFMQRLRDQVNLTMPKIPSVQDATTMNLDISQTDLSSNNSLSESRFRRGLEITLPTDAELTVDDN